MQTTENSKLNPEFLASLINIAGAENVITQDPTLDRLSKDFYWYSPVLKPQLEDRKADVVVKPANREELAQVISAAFAHHVPIVPRGAGTGNYGQCIPLYGGIVIDTSRLDRIFSLDGVAHVEAGARLGTIEAEARKVGWELRCMPSTWVKSSMGGFLGGGSGGIGSVTWGGINNEDNMKSVTLMTAEAEPRLLTFHERDCIKALHTYGTTGFIVEVEMRLAPALDYSQMIVVSDDRDALMLWSHEFALNPDIPKRLVTFFENPIPGYFTPMKKYLPEGKHATFVMVGASHEQEFRAMVEAAGFEVTVSLPFGKTLKPPYITDYTWNHTTLWALKTDPTLTYLQSGFAPNFMEQINLLQTRFPGEIMIHLEWARGNAKRRLDSKTVGVGAIPLIRYKSEERLNEIIDYCTEIGVFTANPHTFTVEGGGAHPDIEEKRSLKKEVDPRSLMNPGKLVTYPHNPFAEKAASA
jgi:FAD/FMN-containing dehydrogenase